MSDEAGASLIPSPLGIFHKIVLVWFIKSLAKGGADFGEFHSSVYLELCCSITKDFTGRDLKRIFPHPHLVAAHHE